MKNICFLNSINFWGGGEKLHLEYATEFQKRKYNVIMMANNQSPLWKRAAEQGIKTFPITASNLSFINPVAVLKLCRFFKQQNVDTVFVSNSQDVKLGSIAAKLAGVKNVVYYRSIDVAINGGITNRVIFKHCLTHIVANSNNTKSNILKNLEKQIDPKSIKTIYYGVDTKKFKNNDIGVLKTIEEKGHGVILGNAGRLTTQKGQQYFIDIAKKLKAQNLDFTLFIAGTGELHDELAAAITENKLQDNVILLGFVEDMELFMNSLDVFVLSSMWEGFGYVIVEAMLKSKPVVAFNMTSNPEIVLDNKTGFLVDHPNLDMFADKIKALIDSEELRTQMGQAGLDSALERFILEDRVTELESFIKNK